MDLNPFSCRANQSPETTRNTARLRRKLLPAIACLGGSLASCAPVGNRRSVAAPKSSRAAN